MKVHAFGGIRTRNLSSRLAADVRIRPRGHRQRLFPKLTLPKCLYSTWIYTSVTSFQMNLQSTLHECMSNCQRVSVSKQINNTAFLRDPVMCSRCSDSAIAGRSGICCGQAQDIFSSKRPDGRCGPPSLLFWVPAVVSIGVNRLAREADHYHHLVPTLTF
jgi:hypothetical protein